MGRKYDVIAAGAATMDTILTGVDSDLMQTDSILAKDSSSFSGGDAVNAAVSMARLGMQTALCACLGNDIAGEILLAQMANEGVDCTYVHRDPALHTSSPIVLVDPAGERHIVRMPGSANHSFTESMIPDVLLHNASHLHVASANVLPALDGEPLGRLFARAHAAGCTTSLDASYDRKGRWLHNIEDALQYCDIFLPSLQEASMYAHTEDLQEICRFFSAYPLRIFGIKLGKKGVLVTDFCKTWQMPSLYKKEPVDTTGAGDAFLAGFVSAWLKGYDIPSCAAVGSAQSCFVLGVRGANTGAGTWEEVLQLLKQEQISLQKRKTEDPLSGEIQEDIVQ